MRGLLAAALLAGAATAPGAHAALCDSVGYKDVAQAGACTTPSDPWLACAGASAVTPVYGAGAGACVYDDLRGVFVGCWTSDGLRCN